MADSELDRALNELALHGWVVHHVNASGYVQLRCSCGGHLGWLHKTPSNPNHFRQKTAHLIRQCSTRNGGLP